MAKTITPAYPQAVNISGLDIENGDGTTEQTLFTAGAEGSVVHTITATSDDTSDRIVKLFANDGTTSYLIGSVTVLDLAGTDGGTNPAQSILNDTDLEWYDGTGIPLESGWTLKAAVTVAVTAAKIVQLVAIGDDY